MGMFDYLEYNGPLPTTVKKKARLRQAMSAGLSQTKSVRLWETDKWAKRAYDEGCVKITISEDGYMLDPDGCLMDWTGKIEFYGGGIGHKLWEFTAVIENGRLVSLTQDK